MDGQRARGRPPREVDAAERGDGSLGPGEAAELRRRPGANDGRGTRRSSGSGGSTLRGRRAAGRLPRRQRSRELRRAKVAAEPCSSHEQRSDSGRWQWCWSAEVAAAAGRAKRLRVHARRSMECRVRSETTGRARWRCWKGIDGGGAGERAREKGREVVEMDAAATRRGEERRPGRVWCVGKEAEMARRLL
ncbi:hypothetical protein E2562_028718 [Oryza meyeriana var. granulata]|uniref:DUF834 domain-containing protein n=1 Tax=Oryza meyeriana var. granulata TaxID=110450 RepID=A0A6G1D9M2_9ORYZ|nr:hypothetical protein E2562_028718 [Oryza meyeriana var. granulata]